MNQKQCQKMQKRMPYKQMFYDTLNACYRLIRLDELYEYRDEEGLIHKRHNVNTLFAVK